VPASAPTDRTTAKSPHVDAEFFDDDGQPRYVVMRSEVQTLPIFPCAVVEDVAQPGQTARANSARHPPAVHESVTRAGPVDEEREDLPTVTASSPSGGEDVEPDGNEDLFVGYTL
jgi:hypothetical protein